ncbi:NIPSNAP family protein [Phyllobacterium sp. 628]|uniref:NIPSNAP family protein n=1 Tax=Phyllobacterium sp. 628 TaxID=2718938 RepID=UPI0016622D06|nr:NIPSNAP family protein [Phyllobacterium sp. 628]QND51756.1 NIPSNAP family protein [Phyllobacterium sp. 628]
MRLVETLIYSLRPGTGAEFHKLVCEESLPIHEAVDMDVVDFGQSAHHPDAYFLVRAYDDLDHLNSSQQALYSSDIWRKGPRPAILERIVVSLKSMAWMSEAAIEETRFCGNRRRAVS